MKHLSFLFALLFCSSINSQTLKPDSSFAETGKNLLPEDSRLRIITDIEFDTEGNIFAIGSGERETEDSSFTYSSMGKLNDNGEFESTFGDDGIVTKESSEGQQYSHYSFTQSDGKILIAGHTFNMYTGDLKSIILRYNKDGMLDKSFADNGVYIDQDEEINFIYHISELASGKILVTGDRLTLDRDPNFILQLNNDGSRNNDFGDQGLVVFEYPDTTKSIEDYSSIFQQDNKILMAGRIINEEDGSSDFLVMRFLEDGTLDENFAVDGFFIFDIGTYDEINHISLQQDGKILVTGPAYDFDNNITTSLLIAARLDQNGDVDNTFGINGIMQFNDFADRILVGYQIKEKSESEILIAGSVYEGDDEADIFIIRLNENGDIDQSLGNEGIFIDDFDGYFDNVYGMKFDSEGRILVYGESIDFEGPSRGFIARYIPDLSLGKLDFEKLKNTLLTYPNPVLNECTLKYELLKNESISVEILNIKGEVQQSILNNEKKYSGPNQQTMNLENLTPGFYIIKLTSESGSVQTKIIKQ